MNCAKTKAHRLLELFELMRGGRPGAALERLGVLNLSFSHVRVLHVLMTGGALAMKDIAARLGIAPPSVTVLVRRLTQVGMVRREPHPDDSRVALIAVTDEGRALLEQLYADQLVRMQRLLGGLSDSEQDLFISLLERAAKALQADS